MDSNQYSNILSAVSAQGAAQGKLSIQQEADNYSAFSQMMKDGIYLPDLTKRISDLESKVKDMEEGTNHSRINKELFEVMEASVRDDPDVIKARSKADSARAVIIEEMCMKDPRYRDAFDEYRTAVNSAYVHQKEASAKGKGTSEDSM